MWLKKASRPGASGYRGGSLSEGFMRHTIFPFLALMIGGAGLAQDQMPAGYLAPGAVDLTKVLPPAPQPGEIRYETDRKVFRSMKALDGARWQARPRTSDMTRRR